MEETNFFREIKNYGIDEMADFLNNCCNCACCIRYKNNDIKCEISLLNEEDYRGQYCKEGKLLWLQQPTKKEEIIFYAIEKLIIKQVSGFYISQVSIKDSKGIVYKEKGIDWEDTFENAKIAVDRKKDEIRNKCNNNIAYYKRQIELEEKRISSLD